MRIGLVAPPWLPVPPPKYGGTEAVVDRLARGFVARGHEVVLFGTGDSTCPVPTAWVYENARRSELGQVVVELRHVIAAYDTLIDFDIVHDHTVVGPMYADRFPGLITVSTAHGPFRGDLEDVYRAISPKVPIIAISHHQASTAGLNSDRRGDPSRHRARGVSDRRRRRRVLLLARPHGQLQRCARSHRDRPSSRCAPAAGRQDRARRRGRVFPGASRTAARWRHRVHRRDRARRARRLSRRSHRIAESDHLVRTVRSDDARSARLRHTGRRVPARVSARDRRGRRHRAVVCRL